MYKYTPAFTSLLADCACRSRVTTRRRRRREDFSQEYPTLRQGRDFTTLVRPFSLLKKHDCAFRISLVCELPRVVTPYSPQPQSGGDRIRTCGAITRTLAFQASAFDHSATPPLWGWTDFPSLSRTKFHKKNKSYQTIKFKNFGA